MPFQKYQPHLLVLENPDFGGAIQTLHHGPSVFRAAT